MRGGLAIVATLVESWSETAKRSQYTVKKGCTDVTLVLRDANPGEASLNIKGSFPLLEGISNI